MSTLRSGLDSRSLGRQRLYSIDHKPFKPLQLFVLLLVVVTTLSALSQLLAK